MSEIENAWVMTALAVGFLIPSISIALCACTEGRKSAVFGTIAFIVLVAGLLVTLLAPLITGYTCNAP